MGLPGRAGRRHHKSTSPKMFSRPAVTWLFEEAQQCAAVQSPSCWAIDEELCTVCCLLILQSPRRTGLAATRMHCAGNKRHALNVFAFRSELGATPTSPPDPSAAERSGKDLPMPA